MKKLSVSLKNLGGRNFQGRITLRNRGGCNKRMYRVIDYYRDLDNIIGIIVKFVYDPNRKVKLAMVSYLNGMIGYIISIVGMKLGDKVKAGEAIGLNKGDSVMLGDVPLGMFVNNVELYLNKGSKLARSAGVYAQVLRRKGLMTYIKLKSKEVRMVFSKCRVTLGRVDNVDFKFFNYRKAGERRWIGRKSNVRGVAKNPVDHPHGGGRGKTKGGRCSVSPWGILTKGYVTRARYKKNKFIVRSRRFSK